MSTKLKGDVAEQAAILEALKRGWEVAVPVGDRLSYGLIIDTNGHLVRIQVKCAWRSEKISAYCVDTRRHNTNRRNTFHRRYSADDFDFAAIYVDDLSAFYVFPVDVFLSYKSHIAMVKEKKKFQGMPKSHQYRNAWHLISEWTGREETPGCLSLKVGEACEVVIPSQALESEEGVETLRETPKQ